MSTLRYLALALAIVQSSPPMEVARVQLVGAKRFAPEDVARLAGVTIGKTVTVEDLNAAAQRLANTGFFEKVIYRYTLAGRRVTVIYDLVEVPWTIPVSLDNFVWFTKDEVVEAVRKDVPTFDGTLPKSQEMPELMVRTLQKLLESKKVPGRVEFSPEGTLSGQLVQYIFAVKDPAPRLCDVQLTGASAIPAAELAAAVRSGSGDDYSGFSVGNVVKGTLIDMYRRRGFWAASFAPPVTSLTSDPACAGVTLSLTVTEGTPYTFAAAQWTGNPSLQSSQLDAALGMKPGQLADSSKIDVGLRAVRREYGRIGHLAMRSTYTPRLDEGSKQAVFEIQVTEGPQFRMGTLEVVGLPAPDIETITQKWRLKAGDPFDEEYAREFQTKEVTPLWRARRLPGKPPQMQTRLDTANRLVNVRILVQ
jgi:outer membrane protein insertion porin family